MTNLTSGDDALADGDYSAAESLYRTTLEASLSPSSAPPDSHTASRARHGLAKCFLACSKNLPDACKLCESVLATPIAGDRDRRLILDAAYTLAMAYLVLGAVPKAKALCQLLIDGNRKFPERAQAMREAIALMVKILEAGRDYKNAKIYARLLPAGFEAPPIRTAALEAQSGPPQSSVSTPDPTAASAELGATSQNGTTLININYETNKVDFYDPSLTRLLLKPFTRKSSSQDATTTITSLTDLRNPSNPLSPHYTPFVTVPVPMSVFKDPTRDLAPPAPARNLFGYLGHNSERFRYVRMSRDDYTKYWARDSNGNYLGTEPEGAGREKVREGWTENGGKSISQLEYVGKITEGQDPFAAVAKDRRKSAKGSFLGRLATRDGRQQGGGFEQV